MDLSSPRLRKILIFVAILVVVVFIAVKIWRRSYYSYPNSGEDTAPVTITAMTQTSSVITITTTNHKFRAGDIVILKNLGGVTSVTPTGGSPVSTVTALNQYGATTGTPVVVATSTAVFTSGLATSAGTTFTVAGTFVGPYTSGGTAEAIGYGVMSTLKTALQACQDTYGGEMITAGTDTNAQQNAATKRTTCIANAVTPYTRKHCQWLPTAASPTILPTPPDAVGGAAKTPERLAWDTYQSDILKIQLGYYQASARVSAGTFSGLTGSATRAGDIVSAARAADIMGATQKYLATVCPGFYQPGDPSQTDPSANYKLWTADITSVTDPNAASTQKHFYTNCGTSGTECPLATPGITDAAILTWAQYARPVTFTTGTGLTATTGYLATSVTVGATTYSDKSGLTNGTAGAENWRTAYTNGPGTFPVPIWKTTA